MIGPDLSSFAPMWRQACLELLGHETLEIPVSRIQWAESDPAWLRGRTIWATPEESRRVSQRHEEAWHVEQYGELGKGAQATAHLLYECRHDPVTLGAASVMAFRRNLRGRGRAGTPLARAIDRVDGLPWLRELDVWHHAMNRVLPCSIATTYCESAGPSTPIVRPIDVCRMALADVVLSVRQGRIVRLGLTSAESVE
jgi:hypothetical protein